MMVFQDENSIVVNEAVCIHKGYMILYNKRTARENFRNMTG